jgi:hypothetical protein
VRFVAGQADHSEAVWGSFQCAGATTCRLAGVSYHGGNLTIFKSCRSKSCRWLESGDLRHPCTPHSVDPTCGARVQL